jgi:hypothetical protein
MMSTSPFQGPFQGEVTPAARPYQVRQTWGYYFTGPNSAGGVR